MDKVRFGIVGLGNQGSFYVNLFKDNKVTDGVLTAVCDIDPAKIEKFKGICGDSVEYFDAASDMFKSGKIDIALIETPHFIHPDLAIEAMQAGLAVCVEKPAGVYTKQVEEMLKVADETGKMLGIMFNQRTNPLFRKMKQMISTGVVGEIKRTSWLITDWYRTQMYYDSGAWRATWAGEGGGVLYNQAPHQLDLFQWILGMTPSKVRAFCHEGKWHDIEVEDDVTAYLEFPNGATGVFITSTGDAPGTNRFEVLGTKGKLVCEHGELIFYANGVDEREFCKSCEESFKQPPMTELKIKVEGENTQHRGILSNLAAAYLGKEKLYADAHDGINGVSLANAMHLSSWLGETITMPIDGEKYYAELSKRMATSRLKDKVVVTGASVDMTKTFNA